MSNRLNPENADNHTFMMTGLLGEPANTTAGMDSDRLSWATIPSTPLNYKATPPPSALEVDHGLI